MTDNQNVQGYACICGFQTDDKKKFVAHFGFAKRDGPGIHKSRGRINLLTGEVIMPPYTERSLEQIYETKHPGYLERKQQKAQRAKQTDVLTIPPPSQPPDGKKAPVAKSVPTDLIEAATQIKFIPRVFTCNLTPIMLLGYEVAIRKWGWRPDIPFENYLDTVIYNFTLEHGTQLQGAITIFDEEESEGLTSEEPEEPAELMEVI